MKLYLSSVGVPNIQAYQQLFESGKTHSIAIIPTAWDVAPAQKAAPFIARTTTQLSQVGFVCHQLNLADFANKQQELQQELAVVSGIWLTGGNTFYLNYWMRESGFDSILPALLQRGLVYAGESAGAVLAGTTLHGIELLDDPQEAPQTIWEGLSLVDYGIIPHWGEPKYADRYAQAAEEMRLFTGVKTLTNQEYIIVSSS